MKISNRSPRGFRLTRRSCRSSQGRRLTYAELHAETDRLARALVASGVEHGRCVGIWSTNSLEWVLVQYATAKIGAILVNINPAYRLNELEYALRQSGVSTLITLDRFKTSDYLAMVRQVRSSLPELGEVVIIGDEPPAASEVGWDDFLKRASQCDDATLAARKSRCQFDEAINIQYVGTTSFPKARPSRTTISLTTGTSSAGMPLHRARSRVHSGSVLPLFRHGARQLGCTTHGAAIVIPSAAFEPELSTEAVVRSAVRRSRRPDHVYRRAGAAGFASTSARCHGDHGRRHARSKMMAGQADMHMPGDDLLRHDRDLTVSAQTMTDDPLRSSPRRSDACTASGESSIPKGDRSWTPGELCTRGTA